MQISDKRLKLRLGWSVIILLLLAATLLFAMFHILWPLSFNCCGIIFDYAHQAVVGNGLVLNAGERVLLVPSPAYLVLLVSAIKITTIPTYQLNPYLFAPSLIRFLFALSLIISALLIFRLLRRCALSVKLLAIAAYSIAWIAFWNGGAISQPTASMLCLLALALAFDDRWQWAGLTLAIATLCNPESSILAIPLLLMAANKGAGWRLFLALLLPLIAAVIALYMYYGAGLWYGPLGYKGLDLDYLLDAGRYELLVLPFAALIVWAFAASRGSSLLSVCGVWIVLHLFIVGILLRSESSLSYVLLASPSILLLFAASQHSRIYPLIWLAPALATILVILSYILIVPPIYGSIAPSNVQIDTYFDQNLRIWSQNYTAFDGQLQPEMKAMFERGDIQSVLIRYLPLNITLTDATPIRARDFKLPGVLPLDYRPQGDASYAGYELHPGSGDFPNQVVSANFGPDIKLVGLGLDRTSLAPGQYARLRLDWQVAHAADHDVTVDLRLVTGDGDHYILAHATDTYDPRVFRVGPYSTYHTLSVVNSAWAGPVTLEAAIVINGGVAARVPIATLTITKP